MKSVSRFFFALSASLSPSAFAVDFGTEVQPILREKCFKCHSGPNAKNGVRYDDAATLAKFIGEGGDTVIKPGKPEESRLIQLASLSRDDSDAMPPPNRGEGLSAPELTLIKQWIAEGAKISLAAPATPAAPPKLHTWSNVTGQTMRAFFVKLEGTTVTFRKEDGGEYTYAMSQLSPDSRKLANELAKAP